MFRILHWFRIWHWILFILLLWYFLGQILFYHFFPFSSFFIINFSLVWGFPIPTPTGWPAGENKVQSFSEKLKWVATETSEILVSREFSRIFFHFHFSFSISSRFNFTFTSRKRVKGFYFSLFTSRKKWKLSVFHSFFSRKNSEIRCGV